MALLPYAGTWLIQEDYSTAPSGSGAVSYQTSLNYALGRYPDVLGMSWRPHGTYCFDANGDLLTGTTSRWHQPVAWIRAWNIAHGTTYKVAQRMTFGRYTPAKWLADMPAFLKYTTSGNTWVADGLTGVHPCYPQAVTHDHDGLGSHSHAIGDVNDYLLIRFARYVDQAMAYQALNPEFTFFHLTWPSISYAEIANPKQTRPPLAPYSQAQFVAAYMAFLDVYVAHVNPLMALEAGATGGGDITGNGLLNALRERAAVFHGAAVSSTGRGSVILSCNGWNNGSIMGPASDTSGETAKQNQVLGKSPNVTDAHRVMLEVQHIIASPNTLADNWVTNYEWVHGSTTGTLPARRTLKDDAGRRLIGPVEVYLIQASSPTNSIYSVWMDELDTAVPAYAAVVASELSGTPSLTIADGRVVVTGDNAVLGYNPPPTDSITVVANYVAPAAATTFAPTILLPSDTGTAEVWSFTSLQAAGNPAQPTPTGRWTTWTLKAFRNVGTTGGWAIWYGSGTKTGGQSPTMNYGAGNTKTAFHAVGLGLTGLPAVDVAHVLRVGDPVVGTAATGSVTIDAPTASSRLLAYVTSLAGTAMAADAGWTELAEPDTGGLNSVVVVSANGTDPSYATSWTPPAAWSGVMLELLQEAVTNFALAVNDGTVAVTGDAAVLTQHHVLAVADGTVAVLGDTAAFTQHSFLVAADGLVVVLGDSVGFAPSLGVTDGTVAVTGDTVTIVQHHVLAVADGTVAVHGDTAAITQHHVLAVADGTVAVTGDTAAITQVHKLIAADGTVTVLGDFPTLVVNGDLLPHDGLVAVLGDTVAFVQHHVLEVADGLVDVTGDSVGALDQVHVLAIAGGLVAVTGDSPALTRRAVLAPASRTGYVEGGGRVPYPRA